MKLKWKDVTDTFSEREKNYNGKYLEQDLVLNNTVELSYFSEPTGKWEIYVSFGIMFGIVFVTPENYLDVYEKMKKDLEKEYVKLNGNVDDIKDDFIKSFCTKYHVTIPYDTITNFDLENFSDALNELEKHDPFSMK